MECHRTAGDDLDLTDRKEAYAGCLAHFMNSGFTVKSDELSLVRTSHRRRARQTVQHIPAKNMCWHAFTEIDAGACEGWTYESAAKQPP